MAAAGFDIAKAGWLNRESSVLHRWKRSWFVLDKLGDLRYFETQDHPVAEERIVIRAVVSQIRTGPAVAGINLPSHLNKASVIVVDFRNGNHLTLCAETPDDMKAWQIALEEARTAYGPPQANVIHQGNTTIINGQPMQTVYRQPYQTTTVIGGPGYYNSGYSGQVITPGVYSSPGVTVLPQTTTVIPGRHLNGATVIAAPQQQVVYMNQPYYQRGLFGTGAYLW